MKHNYTLTGLLLLFMTSLSLAQVTYTGKPRYQIDVKRAGTYIGTVKIELFPNIAYHHTRNFDSLVSEHFYDTTAFHRVIPGFMIQGGDPNSRHGNTSTWGFGDPSQPTVNAEFSEAKHLRGILSAARSSNINSATSQFFICVATAAQLDGQYSIYGRVTEGMNIVDTIVLAPRNAQDRPNLKHEMFITAIGSNDTIPLSPAPTIPVDNLDSVDYNSFIALNWTKVNDGIIYEVEVAYDYIFNDIIKTARTPNLGYTFIEPMYPDTWYYWHVRTNNGGNYSEWSTTRAFFTGTLDETSIPKVAADEKHIKPFPNPGNGKFMFSNLEKGMKINVTDINGKTVYEAVVSDKDVELNLEGKAKGIYIYKILSEDKKELGKGRLIIK
ncbi:MAG: peptidylprolyl isomerase [Bacteroidia bacterium]|nr:peptidylprolyl isomerase [Bacteroidia bacterium]